MRLLSKFFSDLLCGILLSLALTAACLLPRPLAAAEPVDSPGVQPPRREAAAAPGLLTADPDFLFEPPVAAITLRVGRNFARAGGDLFDFFTSTLTLGRRDFHAFSVAGEATFHLGPRLALVAGVGGASAHARSEFRDWEGEDGLPIEQTTRFLQIPITVGAKLYLLPHGRSVGRFAWIPAPFAPYVGAGVGAIRYEIEQKGEFVDYETLDIFADELSASGWALAEQVFGGADINLSRRLFLQVEARYTWAGSEPRGDFLDFDTVDLRGLQTTVGLSLRL